MSVVLRIEEWGKELRDGEADVGCGAGEIDLEEEV